MTARRGLFVAPFGPLADASLIGDLAADAEAAGWDGLFLWDHVAYRDPGTPIADPWIASAAIALRTERLRFGILVTPLPRRRPQIVARQAAGLAQLSGDRFVLGFGIGGDAYGEFSRFGDEPDARIRGRMLDEGLAVLTGMLSGEPVEHEGEFYSVDAPVLPARPIPIWIAGRHPNAAPLRRAARFDGYFPIQVPSPDAVPGIRDALPPGADLVVDVPAGEDPAPWSASGATWVLSTIGPFDIDLDATRATIAAGP